MLTELQVSNYAVIASTSLDLSDGMTVLSGETGAGKSIIVGALSLLLGQRADAGVIRDGCDKAEISAHFDIGDTVAAWLLEQELDADGECLLRRTISREGRSRAWVNGHAVTLQTLRKLGAQLVEIHGQHMQQSLMQSAIQRNIVDSFADNSKLLDQLGDAHQRWRKASEQLEQLQQAATDRDARIDLLNFHIQEIETLSLHPGEYAELEVEQKRLAHAGRIAESTADALRLLDSDEQSPLSRAEQLVARAAEYDQRLDNIRRLLAEAEIQASEAVAELSDYVGELDLDPARRDFVEQRLASIQSLARKHRIEPATLQAYLDQLRAEYDQIDNAQAHLEQLRDELESARAEYDQLANAVHKSRSRAAIKLGKAITAELQELGMTGGSFRIRVEAHAEQRRQHGIDQVDFLVSANPGQRPAVLSKVASGGELSRISLAIEMLTASHQPVPTMIFDEVDTGVGGGIAEIIGHKLRELAKSTQVLCVTHLAQVASQAHHHFVVSKLSDGKSTRTQLRVLDSEQRIEEVARMLGGVKITDTTRRHAEEMLERAGDYRRQSGQMP